eukprot:1611700-Pyramimonas_sp.AAC.1
MVVRVLACVCVCECRVVCVRVACLRARVRACSRAVWCRGDLTHPSHVAELEHARHGEDEAAELRVLEHLGPRVEQTTGLQREILVEATLLARVEAVRHAGPAFSGHLRMYHACELIREVVVTFESPLHLHAWTLGRNRTAPMRPRLFQAEVLQATSPCTS